MKYTLISGNPEVPQNTLAPKFRVYDETIRESEAPEFWIILGKWKLPPPKIDSAASKLSQPNQKSALKAGNRLLC